MLAMSSAGSCQAVHKVSSLLGSGDQITFLACISRQETLSLLSTRVPWRGCFSCAMFLVSATCNRHDGKSSLILMRSRGQRQITYSQVSGSETSEDEARAGWVDLRGLGQGHYCGYLQKKSRKDPSLWRRRWCILAVRESRKRSNVNLAEKRKRARETERGTLGNKYVGRDTKTEKGCR